MIKKVRNVGDVLSPLYPRKNPEILQKSAGVFLDLLYRQTVVNVPALEMRGKIRRLSGKISMKFAILSMLTPLPTFQARLIQVISGSYPGQLWMNSDASGKRSGNVDHGTATVNRF